MTNGIDTMSFPVDETTHEDFHGWLGDYGKKNRRRARDAFGLTEEQAEALESVGKPKVELPRFPTPEEVAEANAANFLIWEINAVQIIPAEPGANESELERLRSQNAALESRLAALEAKA